MTKPDKCRTKGPSPFCFKIVFSLTNDFAICLFKFSCTNISCSSDYIGRTFNRFDISIKRHLPARISNLELKRGQLVKSESSIADHMINNRECVVDFSVDRFSILSRSHSLYQLKVLRPFKFDPFNLPFVNKGTACWG